MAESVQGIRRVCVHSGPAAVDVSLPAQVPVATLIPALVDLLGEKCGDTATRYHLSRLGSATLPASTTLAQNDIGDGTVLILSQEVSRAPIPRYDDAAEAVSTTLVVVQPRNATRIGGALAAGAFTTASAVTVTAHGPGAGSTYLTAGVTGAAAVMALLAAGIAQRSREDSTATVTLGLIAVVFAAVAGYLAVPGPPGLPNVLLAAMTAAVAAVLATRLLGCRTVALTAAAGFAGMTATSALAGVLTSAQPQTVAAFGALASLALVELAPRIAIAAAGLSPSDDDVPADKLTAQAVCADHWLAGLSAAFAASTAVGAVVAACITPRGLALSGITGLLLLLQTRNRRNNLMFAVGGIISAATTFALTAGRVPQHSPWIAASAALLTAAAIYTGFLGPDMPLSPLARRGIDALECLALIAAVPVTCWVSGIFDGVRALHLG
ncbi:ESX-4 secretion system protein eccD4 [Mycobacterium kubicae]|uniref:ESX-4 secretion system protein eccD4 n=1 Tax=Mycobacterium kubicae TaxID=120959 RepID=A0AAX1JEH6_9MYCO|nr:type VII secretion integral membrane protein EccD [Mycobacterium kubicae]MCV7096804.1 type VII secretion integral membrane protein EccD [Mycobacterium kubicae]ORW01527.1 hypothetical protein AWC13_07005 [Mycobacterium kubicae]QNI10771.1 type VII secretion integral membrane protein EccD [Mycobacterium kubicae]QPI38980.1 type VII secretion integral membrane protein EccD [Mycobacterium kubicae]GFG63139.1 ESX-4 secretion system protein eccD4 [Mycobacterium kubicae]